MTIKPKRDDIKSVFAGLRPLAATSDKKSTKKFLEVIKLIFLLLV